MSMWTAEIAEMEAIRKERRVTEKGDVRFEEDGEKPEIR